MSDVAFDQAVTTVQQFASYYGIAERNYVFARAFGVQANTPLRTEIQFDSANSMFRVVCFGGMSPVTKEQRHANTQTLLQSFRREVLAPLALRSLPAADKQRFLQSIADSTLGLPAYMRQLPGIYPNRTDLENAQTLACIAAEDITETDHPGRLDDPNSPWHQVVAQRNLLDPQNDVPATMQHFANNVRAGPGKSKNIFPNRHITPATPPIAEATRIVAPQIGDGNY